MSNRDAILGRLRSRLDAKTDQETRRLEADTRLRAQVQNSLVPKIGRTEGRERIDRFVRVAEAAQTKVRRIGSLAALPEALADALRERNLGLTVRCGDDPLFNQLDWGPVELSRGPGRIEEPASLSVARWAAAETGTLALTSGPDNPVTLTFLGETHFVVLRAKDIAAGLEGVWAKLRAAGIDPRTVNLVTGPSRTGDIAQKLEFGAHGPVELQVFLIEDY